MEPLATVSDLEIRGIDIPDTALVETLLASASAAVRDAAGTVITETTATVALPTPQGRRLQLPGPVQTVESVRLNGEEITDWVVRGDSLWRSRWQCRGDIPGEVEVTLTFGLLDVPEDIVDLVCSLVGAGVARAADGYEAKHGITSERIDDYSVQYTQGADAVVTPMELPARTRRWLASRFGGGVAMVATRS